MLESTTSTKATRRARSALALAAPLLLLLAACGGDDDDAGTATPIGGSGTDAGTDAGGDGLTVVAEDIDFDADSYEAPAGTVDFVYENEGSIVHTLVIEDVDGFKLEVKSNGDVDEGSVELEAGEYVIYCDVPGHRSAGMEAELTVS